MGETFSNLGSLAASMVTLVLFWIPVIHCVACFYLEVPDLFIRIRWVHVSKALCLLSFSLYFWRLYWLRTMDRRDHWALDDIATMDLDNPPPFRKRQKLDLGDLTPNVNPNPTNHTSINGVGDRLNFFPVPTTKGHFHGESIAFDRNEASSASSSAGIPNGVYPAASARPVSRSPSPMSISSVSPVRATFAIMATNSSDDAADWSDDAADCLDDTNGSGAAYKGQAETEAGAQESECEAVFQVCQSRRIRRKKTTRQPKKQVLPIESVLRLGGAEKQGVIPFAEYPYRYMPFMYQGLRRIEGYIYLTS